MSEKAPEEGGKSGALGEIVVLPPAVSPFSPTLGKLNLKPDLFNPLDFATGDGIFKATGPRTAGLTSIDGEFFPLVLATVDP